MLLVLVQWGAGSLRRDIPVNLCGEEKKNSSTGSLLSLRTAKQKWELVVNSKYELWSVEVLILNFLKVPCVLIKTMSANSDAWMHIAAAQPHLMIYSLKCVQVKGNSVTESVYFCLELPD